MNVISCSAPTEYRRRNEDCAFCDDNNPCFDCPYLEVDEIDNDNLDF